MTDIIESESVEVPETVDILLLMVRYGDNHWCATVARGTVEELAQAVKSYDDITAWKVVRVRGLPVEINAMKGLVK